MADPSKLLAQPNNHIQNSIPFKLTMETSQYLTWAELFKIHCRAHDVIDHLTTEAPSDPTKITQEVWNRVVAIVLSWMYDTISFDLLSTIIQTDTTAKKAWDRLKNFFQDNRHSRALALEHQFTNIRIDNFTNIPAY
ncbi:uncharacterized protein [Rutidosis leptorrhynchoides]|uniref:uncharacterized protein n=1 Tax=Rutidosis leptorrhynchoides TaxID=125765 RepID=UPI003A997966